MVRGVKQEKTVTKNENDQTKKVISQRVFNALEFPEELSKGLAKISIIGNQRIAIENMKKIIYCEPSFIKLETDKMIIELNGLKLFIKEYGQECICIEGSIEKIGFTPI